MAGKIPYLHYSIEAIIISIIFVSCAPVPDELRCIPDPLFTQPLHARVPEKPDAPYVEPSVTITPSVQPNPSDVARPHTPIPSDQPQDLAQPLVINPKNLELIIKPSPKGYNFTDEDMFQDASVSFIATLRNHSAAEVRFSTHQSSISVSTLDKDGQAIEPRLFSFSPYFDLNSMKLAFLQTVPPGMCISFRIIGVSSYVETEEGDQLLLFPSTGPGLYTAYFQYHYSGPSRYDPSGLPISPDPKVFRGTLSSKAVTFHVY